MGLHCLLNLVVNQVMAVEMGVDVALLIHATSSALDPQFWAEEPSVACTTARHTRRWIVLLITQLCFLHLGFPGQPELHLLF